MTTDDGAQRNGGSVRDAASLPPSDLPAPLQADIAAMRSRFDGMTRTDPRELGGREAAALFHELTVLTDRMQSLAVRALATVESDGFWAVDGLRTFPGWLAWRERMSIGLARRHARLARALRDELPATSRELARLVRADSPQDVHGEDPASARPPITLEHAQILATVAATSEARRAVLANPTHPCNEAFLLEQARLLPVDQFRAVTRRWAAAADPAADDRGYADAVEREYVELSATLDGFHLAGFLTTENGLVLRTALRAVQGVPAADDHRSAGQRAAGALRDLCRLTLDHGLAGTGTSVRPSLSVLVGFDTLTSLARGAGSSAPLEPGASGPDHLDSAQFEAGQPVPRALLDRLACDSEVHRIVFGPADELLNVGRAERTYTGQKRRAVIARDRHCRYPTCTAPPALSEVHHTRHWVRDHGETDVATGVLLCWYHHTRVHTAGIEVTATRTGWMFRDRHGQDIAARLTC